MPLVIALHASGGTPGGFEAVTGWDRLADAHRFVVAYLGSAAPAWKDPANVSYISAMIRRISAGQHIDPRRVFVTGFSAGAYISWYVACRLSAQVAAIAPVSGGFRPQPCHPAHPVSVLEFMGTHDIVPLTGTRIFPPPAQAAAIWRRIDGCPARAPSVSVVGPVRESLWSGCAGGSAVAFYLVQGGTHAYPGSPELPSSSPDAAFAATPAVWAFFAAHAAGR